MGPNPSFRRGHCLRSNGDCLKVLSSFPNKNLFILRLGSIYRIYAITGKNKWLGGALFVVIAAELISGIFSTFWIGFGPRESLNNFFIHA